VNVVLLNREESRFTTPARPCYFSGSDASKSYWPSSLPAMKRGSSGASTPKSGPVRSVAASSKAAATKFWSKEFQRQFQIPVQLGHVHQLEASSHSRLSPLVLDAASAAQQSVSSSTLAKLASPPEPGFPVVGTVSRHALTVRC
jgi:hypothetical protein